MKKFECCDNCKYLYPLKKFTDQDWEYSHVCLLSPMTEEKDNNCFALTVDDPLDSMCEMFTPEKEVEDDN